MATRLQWQVLDTYNQNKTYGYELHKNLEGEITQVGSRPGRLRGTDRICEYRGYTVIVWPNGGGMVSHGYWRDSDTWTVFNPCRTVDRVIARSDSDYWLSVL